MSADEQALARFGYAQQLLRSMGGFQNFALSFSIISILTGAVTLYGHGLRFGGPLVMSVGWPLVAVFTMFIALSLAAGCKKDPPVAQPTAAAAPVAEQPAADGPPADLVAKFERAMQLVETVVVAGEAAEGDCDQVAANLAPILAGSEAGAMTALDQEEERLQEHGESVVAPHQARIEGLFERLFAVIIPCQEHSDVIESLAEMGLAGSRKSEGE